MYLLLFKQIPSEGPQLYQFFTNHHFSLLSTPWSQNIPLKRNNNLLIKTCTKPSSFTITAPKKLSHT